MRTLDGLRKQLLHDGMVKKIQDEDEKLRASLEKKRSEFLKKNFFLVLRRWNSYTPALRTHDIYSVGGGYFISWHGKGIVIDPGFDFIKNFITAGLRVADIHAIVLTHSHFDHYADFVPLMTLLYEFNDERIRLNQKTKNVHIFANQGALRKCGGWLDMLHKSKKFQTQIARIYALDPFVQTGAQKIPYTSVKLKPTKAYHNEIIAEGYSIGLIIELFSSLKRKGPVVTLGLSGDTRWIEKKKISGQFRRCNLLVIHLGTVNKEELLKGEYYEKHLGILGTARFLLDSTCKYQLSIISEFGEELKPYRREIMTKLTNISKGLEPKNCIVGDVGTKVMLGCGSDTSSQRVKLICEFAACENEAEPHDVYEPNGIVRHYCKIHTHQRNTWPMFDISY